MRIAEEEEEPVPLGTPRNLTRTVVLNQVGITPGGTRRILKSARYNFKEGGDILRSHVGCPSAPSGGTRVLE